MTTARVRWVCPSGCPAVLGSTRPRRDDVVRFCLACSKRTGRLVQRTAPSLDARRERRRESLADKRKADAERERAREAAHFDVHGVDVRAEIAALWSLPVAHEYRTRYVSNPFSPRVVVRSRGLSGVTQGRAYVSRHEVLVNRIPGEDAHEVKDTCAHEVAHLLTPGHGHDRVWRHVYRRLCEEAYGVSPAADEVDRHTGHAARLLREREAAEKGGTP